MIKRLKNTPWFYTILGWGCLLRGSDVANLYLEKYSILIIIINVSLLPLSSYFFFLARKKKKDAESEKIVLSKNQKWLGIFLMVIFMVSTEFFIFNR